jgi:hypothetical protein
MRNLIAPALLLASLTAAPGVFAQTTTTTTTTAGGSTSGQANVGVSLPGATTTTTTTTAVPGGSDHNQMVGRLAVGYFGISNIGAGANVAGMAPSLGSNDTPYAVTGTAPVVGVRYWIDQMIGVDVGVGMTIVGGGGKLTAEGNGLNASTSASRLPFTGFILHGGVPLALASVDYFTFEVIPELNVGFAHSRQAPGPGLSSSGFHFDVGGRVGGEVSFGFMHIPQLSLVGSVGLRFDTDSGSTSTEGGGLKTKVSTSRSEFHTTVGPNPWAIFVNQVAALYYF